jgi:hypothetical protein
MAPFEFSFWSAQQKIELFLFGVVSIDQGAKGKYCFPKSVAF